MAKQSVIVYHRATREKGYSGHLLGSTHYNIDGHIFHVQSRHDKKSEAQKEAVWLRKHGARARVKKIGNRWATLKS